MERSCVSLETARKLKAAGFPQITGLGWISPNRGNVNWHVRATNGDTTDWSRAVIGESFAAPTAQEVAREIQTDFGTGSLKLNRGRDYWQAWIGEDWKLSRGGNICEALATLWLKLQEDK